MPAAYRQTRWLHLTPGRFVLGLLAVEVLLWLSERIGWPGWHKGYAVLACVAVVGGAMLLMLLWFISSVFTPWMLQFGVWFLLLLVVVAIPFSWLAKDWRVLIGIVMAAVVMLLMLLWFITKLLARWRFQFSLRSLLVLVIVVALPFSWLAVEMKWAREQMAAVEAIKKLGGSWYCDWFCDKNGNVDPDARQPEPAWLRSWLGDDFFEEVVIVNCNGTQVTDAGLEQIARLTQLQVLRLTHTKVTDAGVAKLQQALPNCKITR